MMHTDLALGYATRQPAPTQPTALLVLLHGVGGNETNLASLADTVDPDTLVVMPRGPLTLGAGQYAWFQVNFSAAGPQINAAQAEHSRQTLVQLVEQLQTHYGIAPDKTVIAGFSQGGILSASVGLSAPERVAGFGLLSGRILPELQPQVAEPARLTRLRAFVGHGEYDSKLPVVWAQRADQLLNDLGVQHQTRLYPIDHGISAAMQSDFLAWLRSCLAQD